MVKTSFKILRNLSVVSFAVSLTVGTVWAPSAAHAAELGTAQAPYILEQKTLPDHLFNLHSTDQEHIISPNINTSSTANIRVIVQLTKQPVAVGEYAATLGLDAIAEQSTENSVNNQQTNFINRAAAAGIKLRVNYRYNTVLNGLEVTVPANQVPKLAALDGVKSVYENSTYYATPVQDPPTLTASQATYDAVPLSLIGAEKAWQKGLTGKGVKVGVIDTGIDYDHPDLKGAYKGGYDSFDKDDDPYEAPPSDGFAGSLHGTHVSGTIAGRAANTQSEVVQKGVAYGADLYVYRVLGRSPGSSQVSGSSAQIIDGIEHAVKDGMNVINLSLGTDADKNVNSPDSIAINNAVLSGVTAVIANGNSAAQGYYYYSMGSPASAQLAISVGASSIPYTLYNASVTASVYSDGAAAKSAGDEQTVSDQVYGDSTYGLNMLAWTTKREDFASVLGMSAQQGVYVGLGADNDYAGKDVQGKVVLISRGVITFADKITNAHKYGAKAAIIFNGNSSPSNSNEADLSDSISGRDGHIGAAAFIGEGFDYVPAFDMSGKEGRALARAALESANGNITFTFGSDYPKTSVSGDHIAYFSSRGPNQDGLLGIKPDISAPGVGIRSTIPAYGKYFPDASYSQAYERESGTSMASPHVAGMAVLLKQEHPDWTPFDIRAALANTSDTLFDEQGKRYDVYSQGAGRANVGNAIDTPAILETVEDITILDKDWNKTKVTNYNPSAAFGLIGAGDEAVTKQLQLKNTSGSTVTYTATVKLHPSVTSDPYNPVATPDVNNITATLEGVDANGTVTAAPGQAAKFALSFKAAANAADGPYEGDVVLTAAGYPTLHLPFVAQVGKSQPNSGLGLQELTVSNPVIRLDGTQDSTNIRFHIVDNKFNLLELDITDLDGKSIGILGQKVLTPEAGATTYPTFTPGYYEFNNIDNVYMTYDDKNQLVYKPLKKGKYKLELYAIYIAPGGYLDFDSLKSASAVYRIDGTESDRVNTAAKAFNYIIDGNSVLGKPVLNLPNDGRLQYKVLSSSDTDYVDNSGILIKYPNSSYRIARLQVQISSIADPTVTRTVQALVKITKPQ